MQRAGFINEISSFVLSGFIMRSLRLNRAVVEAQTCGR